MDCRKTVEYLKAEILHTEALIDEATEGEEGLNELRQTLSEKEKKIRRQNRKMSTRQHNFGDKSLQKHKK